MQQLRAKDASSGPWVEARPRVGWRIPVLVALVALVVRLVVVLRGGGLHALMGYDDGVYFTAAAKLLFGQVPYRDFVLLHPPLITLVLVSSPMMLEGLAIGVAISLFQALTQIQEMTLVFVPKI